MSRIFAILDYLDPKATVKLPGIYQDLPKSLLSIRNCSLIEFKIKDNLRCHYFSETKSCLPIEFATKGDDFVDKLVLSRLRTRKPLLLWIGIQSN